MKMDEILLEEVEVYQYLGVQIDNSLSFKVYARSVIKNVAHKIHFLSKIRPRITQYAAMQIHKSMIIPLFDIGDTFYNSTTKAL